MRLEEEFKNLTFIYESLFMGNDKQLLVYRTCTAIDRYIERYRLPNDFKKRLDILNKIAENFYDQKRLGNFAISRHPDSGLHA